MQCFFFFRMLEGYFHLFLSVTFFYYYYFRIVIFAILVFPMDSCPVVTQANEPHVNLCIRHNF
jgi:hypothetical protein